MNEIITIASAIDARWDLTWFFAAVSIWSGLSTVWVNQCLTQHAGTGSTARANLLFLRLAFGALSIALIVSGAYPIVAGIKVGFIETMERCAVFLCLAAVPRAVGGAHGINHLLALKEAIHLPRKRGGWKKPNSAKYRRKAA